MHLSYDCTLLDVGPVQILRVDPPVGRVKSLFCGLRLRESRSGCTHTWMFHPERRNKWHWQRSALLLCPPLSLTAAVRWRTGAIAAAAAAAALAARKDSSSVGEGIRLKAEGVREHEKSAIHCGSY